jgi:carboxylesterase type B
MTKTVQIAIQRLKKLKADHARIISRKDLFLRKFIESGKKIEDAERELAQIRAEIMRAALDTAAATTRDVSVLDKPDLADLYQQICASPGMSFLSLYSRYSDVCIRGVVHLRVKKLISAGLVLAALDQRGRRYYPAPPVVELPLSS